MTIKNPNTQKCQICYITNVTINWQCIQRAKMKKTLNILDRKTEWVVTESLKNSQGAIAQLGERLNGIQEVSGSIPLSSTKKYQGVADYCLQPLFCQGDI